MDLVWDIFFALKDSSLRIPEVEGKHNHTLALCLAFPSIQPNHQPSFRFFSFLFPIRHFRRSNKVNPVDANDVDVPLEQFIIRSVPLAVGVFRVCHSPRAHPVTVVSLTCSGPIS